MELSLTGVPIQANSMNQLIKLSHPKLYASIKNQRKISNLPAAHTMNVCKQSNFGDALALTIINKRVQTYRESGENCAIKWNELHLQFEPFAIRFAQFHLSEQ